MAQTITLDELIGRFKVLLFDSDGVLAQFRELHKPSTVSIR